MHHGVRRSARFHHSVLAAVGALALLALGCGGSAVDTSPRPKGSAGSTGSAAAASLGGANAATPIVNTSGGASGGTVGSNVVPAGGAPAMAASGSGGTQTSSSGTPGIDFSHGTRLLIPQRHFEGVNIGTQAFELSTIAPLNLTVETPLVDAPAFTRQFEVSFASTLAIVDHCQERRVKFKPTSVEVRQDQGKTGAHLTIEQTSGHYLLTHDGAGSHELWVQGTLHVEATDALGATCATKFPSTAVDIAVTLGVKLNIEHLGSVTGSPRFGCGAAPVMLSGRMFDGTSLSLLNDAGKPISGANVYSEYPVDILVETEKSAQIAEAGSGLYYDGLIVTGEPQMVRLSTAYGTLFTYFLANTSLIDGMDVKFWSRGSQDVKAETSPLTMTTTPAIASYKVIGATATLSVGGVTICTPPLVSDYQTTLLSPRVCNIQDENGSGLTPGIPGFLATFLEPAGTCELEISVPGANGERGLSTHLSAVLKPAVN